MSPAIPIARLLVLLAENSGVILTVAGSASLAYVLTRPENKRAIDSSLANLALAIEQIGNQAAMISVPMANNVGRQLDYTRQQLRDFQEKLALIDTVLPIAKEYLGKVGRLIRKLDQVNTKLSDRVRENPLNIDKPISPQFSDSPVAEIPVSPSVDDRVRGRGTGEVNRQIPPVSWPTRPVPSDPPSSNRQDRARPNPTPVFDDPLNPQSPDIPVTPSSDGIPWTTTNRFPLPGDQIVRRPGDLTLVPNNIQFGPHPVDISKNPIDITKTVPRARPISRTKPKIDTNQPGCKDPNSWSEKFKQFLEFAIDQLGQELIQTMADRAGEVFEKAFAARDEAIRKNPDFDKGKPDLRKTLEDSIGKEFDKLSPQTQKDLREYYQIKPQPDGRNIISRKFGRGSDPTLPPIQIKNGIVIPELLANNNRLSSGVDLGKEFAKGHGFNPTKSGVLQTASNGQTLSQTAAIKSLIGPVQIHHKITDALWQSHPLTQAIQAKIDAGSKSLLGLNHSSNLIAAYKSPEAKAAYQKMLTEIGKTDPKLKTNIERNLSKLESGKAMLSDLYHNGSHPKWDSQVSEALSKQVEILEKKFGTKDMSKIPEKDLNNAYRKATMELGDKLHKTNEKLRQNQPLDKDDKKWVTPDYCSPKDKQKTNPGTRISVNPDKDTAWDSLMAATERSNNLNQKNSNNQLASASHNNQNLQAENTGQKMPHNSIRSPIWAETMNLANQLKESSKNQSLQSENTHNENQQASNKDSVWAETMKLANELKASTEVRIAQKEEQQLASQQQENAKQQKRGFEYGA